MADSPVSLRTESRASELMAYLYHDRVEDPGLRAHVKWVDNLTRVWAWLTLSVHECELRCVACDNYSFDVLSDDVGT